MLHRIMHGFLLRNITKCICIHGWLSTLWHNGLFGGPIIIWHLILRVPKKGTRTLSTAHISIVSTSNISTDISFHPKPKTWAAAAGNQEVGSLLGT